MTKARDLANAGTALTTVSATELGYLDGVTSAVQTQINSKIGQATAINPTVVDAKGDIIAATAADTVARLAVGANDTVLTADSSTATGLKWSAPASSSGPAFSVYLSSNQTGISNGVWTKVNFNAENFDTDNCFDPSTNYRFTPTKAGYYQIDVVVAGRVAAGDIRVYKNGSGINWLQAMEGDGYAGGGGCLLYMNGTTDYLEIYGRQFGSSLQYYGESSQPTFWTGVWIRS